jgi:hypothetical protein
VEEISVNARELFRYPTYADQTHMAKLELCAFICAAMDLFGPDDAKLAAQDWLNELLLVDSQPRQAEIGGRSRLANSLTTICSPELTETNIP